MTSTTRTAYSGNLRAAAWLQWSRYFSSLEFRAQAIDHAHQHHPDDRIRTRFDHIRGLTWQPIASLPALSGCPWCGMTNVVSIAGPVVDCTSCGDDYFPVGVVNAVGGEIVP